MNVLDERALERQDADGDALGLRHSHRDGERVESDVVEVQTEVGGKWYFESVRNGSWAAPGAAHAEGGGGGQIRGWQKWTDRVIGQRELFHSDQVTIWTGAGLLKLKPSAHGRILRGTGRLEAIPVLPHSPVPPPALPRNAPMISVLVFFSAPDSPTGAETYARETGTAREES
ncbi:unnamed protein product [Cutaneotrichosporon oleaginosum]